jgi:hypothetical protein
MSPPKGAKKAKMKALTIEFSGISTLLWNQKAGTVRVQLVDLGSAGFQRHYAALSMPIREDSPLGVKGPNADIAVSVFGEDTDIGVWNLLGTTVEIIGATGKLTIDASKVDVTKKPSKKTESIRWLADIGLLCESHKVDPICPTAAVIDIPAGHITAAAQDVARKLSFTDNGTPVEPDRYCTPRFKTVIPFESELAIRLSRERVLRFTQSTKVIVSNTCVCGLGAGPVANHFYGHYDAVKAKRRPTVKRAGPQPLTPQFPEICYGGFVEL